MVFKKYIQKTLVVGATQITDDTAGNYGVLGTLTSGDNIITFADGTITTVDATTLTSFFVETSSTIDLTGESYLFNKP